MSTKAAIGLLAILTAHAADPAWEPLFDGRTLTGWVQRGGKAKYEVRDGAIVGITAPNTQNSFLCTARVFGDFILELEFKAHPELNSGVQVRGQSDPAYRDGRVHGYQVEIDPDVKRGRLWTGGLYDEARRGWLADLARNEAARHAFRGGEWNRLRVEARGPRIRTWINGVAAADVTDALDPEGFIGLQVHAVGTRTEALEVAFRGIRIVDLGRRAWLPMFDAKDLRRFRVTGGTWSVRDGVLTGAGPGVLRHEGELAATTARLDYKLTGAASLRSGPRADLEAGDGKHITAPLGAAPELHLDDGAKIEVRRYAMLSPAIPPPVPGFPVGRCVRVLGVTAPEDARTVGFEYLELALQDLLPLSEADFDREVARLRALGMPLLSGYGFLPADLKIVGPDVKAAAIDAALSRGLARAARFGLKMAVYGNLNTSSRRAPEGFPRERAWEQLVDFGRRAAAEGRRHGVIVLIEPMPARSTNTINTVAEGLRLVRAVGDDYFQMLVDYSFMSQGGEDMSILHEAARHIRQVEISNPNGRVYPRAETESDYAAFFRALAKGGYRGAFSIHGAPDIFFADAPRAIALLRRLAAAHLTLDRR